MFKKNNIYKLGGKKMCCILVGDGYACLVPINAHRNDNGYTLNLSKPSLYPSDMSAIKDIWMVGGIRDGVYVKRILQSV